MNELLSTALYFLERGIATIPIRWRAKRPNLPAWEMYQDELPTELDLRCWFASSLNNIAVIAGWSNLVIVDFDDLEKFESWCAWNNPVAQHVRKNTRIVFSARGAHVYVFTTEPAANAKYEGLDILAQRKYALMPPSIHPSGKSYRYRREADIVKIGAIEEILPEFLKIEKPAPPFNTEQNFPSISRTESNFDIWNSAEEEILICDEKSLVEAVRAKYRVEQFFPDAQRSSRGQNWLVAKCPFHDDKTPSFWIDTDRQICGCYAGCTNRPLDVINLYARLHGISNIQSLNELRSMV